MAFGDPLQWLVIGIIVVVIFLYGPQKIPELAKAFGRAKGEFDKASKEFQTTATATANSPTPKTADQILLDTARQLGISTEGKSREQLSQEIVAKTKTQS
jgi:sec-independent protein translocase protein TatA